MVGRVAVPPEQARSEYAQALIRNGSPSGASNLKNNGTGPLHEVPGPSRVAVRAIGRSLAGGLKKGLKDD